MYYLVGKSLKHSKSKEIHESFSNIKYDLLSLSNISELKNYTFSGLNITIPYKQVVKKFCNELSIISRKTNVVNTIYKKDNKIIGDNTDYYGFKMLLEKNQIDVSSKKVLILGTGGSAQTVLAVVEEAGAISVDFASRNQGIKYSDIEDKYDIVVNTTPVGMYPNNDLLINIKNMNVETVIDLVYNPLQTKLLIYANAKNKVSGLYMLVAQAFASHQLFTNKKLAPELLNQVYKNLKFNMTNVVLIGMPMSGKSRIGKKISRKLNRTFVDTDSLIEENTSSSIKALIEQSIEMFRAEESKAIASLTMQQGLVIATGGGAVLKETNMNSLRQNGLICYIKRSFSYLASKNMTSRPLLKSKHDLRRTYNERQSLYTMYSDIIVSEDNILEKIYEAI